MHFKKTLLGFSPPAVIEYISLLEKQLYERKEVVQIVFYNILCHVPFPMSSCKISYHLITIHFPVFLDPLRTRIPFSCNFFKLRSIVRFVTPILAAMFSAVSSGFPRRTSNIFFSVAFKPTFVPTFIPTFS